MLKPAILYKEEIEKIYRHLWFDDYYKYYNYNTVWGDINIQDKTNDWHEFVSINKDGKILGLITYYVVRSIPKAQSLGILSFLPGTSEFGRDVLHAVDDMFTKFNLHKLDFGVVIGNPVEKTYDNLCRRYGGRILCIEKEETRLQDNKLYDVKRYEIMREDYLKARENKNGMA